MSAEKIAPGAPGIAPTWASSDKDFVTTALGASRLWATIGHGVINEVYWPTTGQPQLRDIAFGMLVGDRFVDLKRERAYTLSTPAPHVPLLTIAHEAGVTFEVLPDPSRDTLLVRYDVRGGRLVLFAAPRLGETGHGNTAFVANGALFAESAGKALCIAADTPFETMSAGFSGASDGWRDLARNGHLEDVYTRAPGGNVALTAILPEGTGILALAFADTATGARTHALSSLGEGFDAVRSSFVAGWEAWGAGLRALHPDPAVERAARFSATVLKIHEDRTFPGAIVASLSVPWGNTSDSSGGYHLVWPRDATLSAFALIAVGLIDDARRILAHLIAVQDDDGGWAQCAYPDGTPYWTGEQLDEIAFPILLAAKIAESGGDELPGTRRMVRAAARHLLTKGPMSPQDRWEENPGFSPFTLAADIAGLVAAGPWLDPAERDEAADAADERNERLEGWCAAGDGAARHYVRIGPPAADGGIAGRVQLRNRSGESIAAANLLGLEYAALVRMGLRAADSPLVRATTARVDAALRVATPSGPLYRRYNEDGYGEHDDGSAFDGSGVGRAWPLLAGERGHLALADGEDAGPYLAAMMGTASAGGLMPEQVWDAPPIPQRGLVAGRPSGSAMPLVWAHAEFLKLVATEQSGRPVELLAAVEARYAGADAPAANAWRWRADVPIDRLPPGRAVIWQDVRPFTLHFGFDGWTNVSDREAVAGPFGLFTVTLDAGEFAGQRTIEFTRRIVNEWEGRDWTVVLTI
ncbi:glycoside hydrolase family 15 protein [Acuticoccus sp. MNP-M23]|uniref:glycoside hydrolase family 15 protein n=1 Tax=Acuticoccus sp. MNP-M23 TaxID=3072793 RepID=UPI00281580DF|nr:glycoside hydrolase family 15 protein [Acuticoccus sp. MNP-M23]WMS41927.1 glycoside hydrolase family 15 protein [Acuticoccus sp. MNP-M23]